MKKIIEGKTYNTETALLLGDWQNLWKGDYHYCREELYRTKREPISFMERVEP